MLFVRQLRRLMLSDRHMQHPRYTPPPPPFSPSMATITHSIHSQTHLPSLRKPVSSYSALFAAQLGQSFPPAVAKHAVLPTIKQRSLAVLQHSIYGARFDDTGRRFILSSKDRTLRVYDTHMSDRVEDWRHTHEISAMGTRWTVTDFALSPNGRYLAYASIRPEVHIVDLERKREPQTVLEFDTDEGGMHGIWSLCWNADGTEIIVGTSPRAHFGRRDMFYYGCIIIFDVQRRKVVQFISAHEDDVNCVALLQKCQSDVLLSASDDAYVKMWDRRDRRIKAEISHGTPVGVFVGHQYGLTHLCSKDDGRYFLSNSKDQFIKLWDTRHYTSTSCLEQVQVPPRNVSFDYRGRRLPHVEKSGTYHDNSIASYGGSHETLKTLIRARFSPLHSTGQRYIYCGSSNGTAVIYDVVTGKRMAALKGHDQVVRDVSWHPYAAVLTTGSWDGTVGVWSTRRKMGKESENEEEEEAGASSR